MHSMVRGGWGRPSPVKRSGRVAPRARRCDCRRMSASAPRASRRARPTLIGATIGGVPASANIDTSGHRAAPTPYRPGACNIGPAEIARRRRGGWIGLGAAGAWAVVTLFVGAGPLVRFGIILPLTGSFVGFLQARRRFCAAYGFLGLRNFGRLGEAERIDDAEARRQDRAAALRLCGEALFLALPPSLLFALVPVR